MSRDVGTCADDSPLPLRDVIAELRRELGDDAVVLAAMQSRHLPEGRFRWRPIDDATITGLERRDAVPPHPRTSRIPSSPLVRRLFSPPVPLAADSRRLVEAWLLSRVDPRSHIEQLVGPFVIAGGWWTGKAVRREFLCDASHK